MSGFIALKDAATRKEGLRVTGVQGLPGIWIVPRGGSEGRWG